MRFPSPLIPARLIRRYKRFLADCVLEEGGAEVVAHCPNPGSMLGLAEPGSRIWLEPTDDPARKLRFGWRLVEHPDGHFTGIDTTVPNRMLRRALEDRAVPAFADYPQVQAEVRYGERSRADFRLTGAGFPDAWVEVKSVTLGRTPGLAEFPDSVTARGARHMAELAAMAAAGHRAAVLFLVQRTDAERVGIAADIDPAYAAALTAAHAAGVEVIAHRADLSPDGVTLGPALPVTLPVPRS